MIEKELQALIADLTLSIKKNVPGFLLGETFSKKNGAGLQFDQLRDYQYGDDVRTLDWAGYARTQRLFVRTYHEERSFPVTIVVDASASLFYGSTEYLKYDIALRVALIFALIAEQSKQRVQLVVLQGKQVSVVPFGNGHEHIRAIARTLYAINPHRQQTCAEDLFNAIVRNVHSASLLIICSDFLGLFSNAQCAYLHKLHEVICVQILDVLELAFPPITTHLLQQNNQNAVIDGSTCMALLYEHEANFQLQSRAYGFDRCTITTKNSEFSRLFHFLRKRTGYAVRAV